MDINNLMKQAQQMQEKMAKMQEKASNAEVAGESGGGMVKIVMTGRYDVKKVTIDPSFVRKARRGVGACVPREVTEQ